MEAQRVRFTWPHTEPNDVIVTGTFDQWQRTIHLTKSSTGFAVTVPVPYDQKISYKYIVDGQWTVCPTEPTEFDDRGNLNNYFFSSSRLPSQSPSPITSSPPLLPRPGGSKRLSSSSFSEAFAGIFGSPPSVISPMPPARSDGIIPEKTEDINESVTLEVKVTAIETPDDDDDDDVEPQHEVPHEEVSDESVESEEHEEERSVIGIKKETEFTDEVVPVVPTAVDTIVPTTLDPPKTEPEKEAQPPKPTIPLVPLLTHESVLETAVVFGTDGTPPTDKPTIDTPQIEPEIEPEIVPEPVAIPPSLSPVDESPSDGVTPTPQPFPTEDEVNEVKPDETETKAQVDTGATTVPITTQPQPNLEDPFTAPTVNHAADSTTTTTTTDSSPPPQHARAASDVGPITEKVKADQEEKQTGKQSGNPKTLSPPSTPRRSFTWSRKSKSVLHASESPNGSPESSPSKASGKSPKLKKRESFFKRLRHAFD